MISTGTRSALLRRLLPVPLGLLLLARPGAAQKHMGVDEVRAGMVGQGHTVFSGTTVESFKVRILGVLRNAVGPQRHLILARLEGAPLERTGVIGGMSGSPVYIDGRLVGAVAFSVGSFATEPIAGITPFSEMREATMEATRSLRSDLVRRLAPPFEPEAVRAALKALLGDSRPFVEEASGLESVTAAGSFDRTLITRLRPIATPLALSGFEAGAARVVEPLLADAGFTPVVAGAAEVGGPQALPGPPPPARIAPGDALGVELVAGDMSVGATGTVTAVDGDRVYAFGHSLFTLGPVGLPMTRAHVHAVLPSLSASTRIASTGETIGTITEDRLTAVAGLLGPGPAMIPVSVTLDQGGGPPRTFRFRVAHDQAFTPLLIQVTVANVLASYERQMGPLTLSVRGAIGVRGQESVRVDEAFTGQTAVSYAAAAVAGPVTLLMANDVEPAEIESITLEVSSAERTGSWVIERAWLDDPRPRPGRTVALKVALRPYRGATVVHTVPVAIPVHAPDRLTLQVVDGTQLARNDERDARWPQSLNGAGAIVAALNAAPRSNRLYVRLLAPSAGLVVGGTRLPALPPSALAVYDADRNGSAITSLRSAILGEWVIPTSGAVVGMRTLPVDLAAPR